MSKAKEIKVRFNSGRVYKANAYAMDTRYYWVIRRFNKNGDVWDTLSMLPRPHGKLGSTITLGRVLSEIEDWEEETLNEE